MKDRNIFVGLDVGTTKVCTIVGTLNGDKRSVEVIGLGSHPSVGLKKGVVVNIEKTVHSIRASVEEAKLMAGVDINVATIGIAGGHIYSFNSTGVVAIKDKVVRAEDIERVMEAARAVIVPSDKEIIHVIPQSFKVDSTSFIKDPLSMHGTRLEASVHIVTASVNLIQNLVKCVEQAGIKVNEVILQPLASSEAVLDSEEKEAGVLLVDIGGGTTDLAVWKNNELIHSQVIPVGGNHFTNDLAVALKVPHREAERIKVHHGRALKETINQTAHVTVQGMEGTGKREVELKNVAEVIGARCEEIFYLIKKIIAVQESNQQWIQGVVLTGGGAMIKDLTTLAEYILEKPCKIGHPAQLGGMTNLMNHPKFSTVLGLLLMDSNKFIAGQSTSKAVKKDIDLIQKLGQSIKSAFMEIF